MIQQRRHFLGAMAMGTLLAGVPMLGRSSTKARVVIVGGGFSGAMAARYIGLADSSIEVTLIERSRNYYSCPFSNKVVAGLLDLDALKFNLNAHASRGVRVVYDEATDIDPAKRSVSTRSGQQFAYDRLIVAPGIQLNYAAVPGAEAGIENVMPHAWKAGEQTLLLRKQLEDMRDGGTFIVNAPPRPYRCPPGPYERASLVAHYLKRHKPKSKVLIIDDEDSMPKQGLFLESWAKHYPGMIEWLTESKVGELKRVDMANRTLVTDKGSFKGDVVSFIPPQKAADLAVKTGLTDKSGWCPVDPVTLESKLHKQVHVIGDATVSEAPKSAHVAGSMGKTVAQAVVALLQGKPVPKPNYVNTCYTLTAPDHGFSIVGLFAPTPEGRIGRVKDSVTLSPVGASEFVRRAEAEYAYGWLRNITTEAFL